MQKSYINLQSFMKTGLYVLFFICLLSIDGFSNSYRFSSDGYLKAVEMNVGDTLIFQLKNGESRQFILLDTSAEPLFVFDNPDNQWHSGVVYSMNCIVLADGQELHLKRVVSAQQSYYEPWHINGVTFFFDAVKAIDDFIKDNHGSTGGSAFPKKDARFAFIEYEDDFSIQPLKPWYPNNKNFISIKDAYEGADSWLGGFKKDEAHNGLDINVPNNTPLWAPIDFDDQYYFNSLANGDNNNRWMGIRTWPNAEKWILRSHHMTELKVEQNTPLQQDQFYGTVGGVHFGSNPHLHFYFIWEKNDVSLALDPWMILWKIFENNKKRAHQIRAIMNPLKPARVGEKVSLEAGSSVKGVFGPELKYYWSVNDGAFYEGERAEHVFIAEGVQVVSLTVTDGTDTATINQQITINSGTPTDHFLRLTSEDPFNFRSRTAEVTEIYGRENHEPGNKVYFFFRKEAEYAPLVREVILTGSESVLSSLQWSIEYLDYDEWLQVEKKGNRLQLTLLKNYLSKAEGKYLAKVNLASLKTGIRQSFYVEAIATDHRYSSGEKVIVDDKQAQFFPSAFYWIEEPYDKQYLKGVGSVSFWAGSEKYNGIARYQPELSPGKYKISLHDEAIYEPRYAEKKSGIIHLKIKTVDGIQDIHWDPRESRLIGTFNLYGGKDSYVDFLTLGSTGQLYLDALIFEKLMD